jgi:hypothetical protein
VQTRTALGMKRRLLIALGILVTLALAVFVSVRKPTIGPDAFRRIQVGMTQEEVASLIGLPSGDYYSGRPAAVPSEGAMVLPAEAGGTSWTKVPHSWISASDADGCGVVRTWFGNYYVIEVAFDEQGRAVAWQLGEVIPQSHRGIVAWIRACFGP